MPIKFFLIIKFTTEKEPLKLTTTKPKEAIKIIRAITKWQDKRLKEVKYIKIKPVEA